MLLKVLLVPIHPKPKTNPNGWVTAIRPPARPPAGGDILHSKLRFVKIWEIGAAWMLLLRQNQIKLKYFVAPKETATVLDLILDWAFLGFGFLSLICKSLPKMNKEIGNDEGFEI